MDVTTSSSTTGSKKNGNVATRLSFRASSTSFQEVSKKWDSAIGYILALGDNPTFSQAFRKFWNVWWRDPTADYSFRDVASMLQFRDCLSGVVEESPNAKLRFERVGEYGFTCETTNNKAAITLSFDDAAGEWYTSGYAILKQPMVIEDILQSGGFEVDTGSAAERL